MRGFTVGSNRDLSLNSGFRMQLNGALSKDIDVTAALTDENSPIQPEGTTQTLREVDKVFVELHSRDAMATLGDFSLDIDHGMGGEFGSFSRRLQGASTTFKFRDVGPGKTSITSSLTAATARGKYSTNSFQGIDGNQGPYRLTGKNGEQRIIILAGTERVYLDGEIMTRGETIDYVIEYSSGDVTFTSKRLITHASRITIDFEYSDQQYARNLVSLTTGISSLSERLKLNVMFTQEADDPDSPVDFAMTDSARAVLRTSGSDPIRASFSGIHFLGTDSLGNAKGQYTLRDTVINNKKYSILVYAPGDPGSLYAAIFSPVVSVPPDSAGYSRIASGEFRFVGIGQGEYLPNELLPMPQLHRIVNINGSAEVTKDLKIAGEYASSRFDLNRFSLPDNEQNAGGALKFSLQYNPKNITLGGQNVGNLDLQVSERRVDRNFVPLDRFNDVEFDRKWNLLSQSAADEEIHEGTLAYAPTRGLRFNGGYGSLERSSEAKSVRTFGGAEFKDSTMPSVEYKFEDLTNDDNSVKENSTWFRQSGFASYQYQKVNPGIRVENERRTISPFGLDSLKQGSFRFTEIAPSLGFPIWGPLSASLEVQARSEDSAAAGVNKQAFQSLTQLYSWRLSEWKDLSSSFSLSLRSTHFADDFKKRGNNDGEYILVRSQSRYTPLKRSIETDLYYEFSNQRSSRLERVFFRVPKGTGNYVFMGDLNGNGIADENEFELTRFDGDYIVLYVPSDQLYPVADLKSSIRLRLRPSRLLNSADGLLARVVRAISTETYVRIEEKSSDPVSKDIYFFNLDRFQNEKTTIEGSSQVQQDLFLFESNQDLSFRFRYNQRDGFVQFVTANERSLLKEQSIRIRSQLSSEIGNQTDVVAKEDKVDASSPTSRERNISSTSLNSDFSYKPELRWEIGFNFSVSRSVDAFNQRNTVADLNTQGIRVAYGFPGAGQLRGEFNREEVALSNVVSDPVRGIPFEMTNGRAIGKNFLWQLAFDYRIDQNIQVSIQYNGRSEGSSAPVHLARAEARAFF